MTRPSKKRTAAAESKEQLVAGIIGVLERTYAIGGQPGTVGRLAEFFRALDEPTLKEIAYRHGVFEGEGETEPEENERDRREGAVS
jgi:hypothetical protein